MGAGVTLDRVREAGLGAGFQDVGAWIPEPLAQEREILRTWLEAGFGATMTSLRRGLQPVRSHPNLSWAKALLVFVVRWDHLHAGCAPRWAAWAASYARGPDYHRTVAEKLARVASELGFRRSSAHVDATPLPERAIARRAGLGWLGRNRFLIHPHLGGDVCLAELAVDEPISFGEGDPIEAPCGECAACIDACPTGALTADGVDARRCVAYHTSRSRRTIPHDLRPSVTLVVGCDACLRACPYGKACGESTQEERFLEELITARTLQAFDRVAAGTVLAHLGRAPTVRNAVVVAGARRLDPLVRAVEDALANDPSPLVRAHAAWALGRLPSRRARRVLDSRVGTDPDPTVREELRWALEGRAGACESDGCEGKGPAPQPPDRGAGSD